MYCILLVCLLVCLFFYFICTSISRVLEYFMVSLWGDNLEGMERTHTIIFTSISWFLALDIIQSRKNGEQTKLVTSICDKWNFLYKFQYILIVVIVMIKNISIAQIIQFYICILYISSLYQLSVIGKLYRFNQIVWYRFTVSEYRSRDSGVLNWM